VYEPYVGSQPLYVPPIADPYLTYYEQGR
jgi:hypothetical protein